MRFIQQSRHDVALYTTPLSRCWWASDLGDGEPKAAAARTAFLCRCRWSKRFGQLLTRLPARHNYRSGVLFLLGLTPLEISDPRFSLLVWFPFFALRKSEKMPSSIGNDIRSAGSVRGKSPSIIIVIFIAIYLSQDIVFLFLFFHFNLSASSILVRSRSSGRSVHWSGCTGRCYRNKRTIGIVPCKRWTNSGLWKGD